MSDKGEIANSAMEGVGYHGNAPVGTETERSLTESNLPPVVTVAAAETNAGGFTLEISGINVTSVTASTPARSNRSSK